MLDDIERRRLLVQPARENAVPALVRLLDVELDERAGQLFLFPRRGRLARAEPDDEVLPAGRLAGVERDILDDAVALVEDPQHRDPLRHRRHPALAACGRSDLPRRWQRHILLALLPTCSKRERDQQRCRDGPHAYSGIQGS
jgi:hypothetical protein